MIKTSKEVDVIEQKLDLQLYALWVQLSDLTANNYGNYINKRLRNFINLVESKVFDPIPDGYDIAYHEAYLKTHLER